MDKKRLEKQLEFCREIDKEKCIYRQTLLADGKTYENDAEHAWHMAVMSLILSEYSNSEIDLFKTISMMLVHDIVEVDAGDTYAYDESGTATQHEREMKAADRIFGLLPDDQKDIMRALWDEFEAGETPEAKFAHTMDNFQPAMLNALTNGKKWKENNVKLSQILKRNKQTSEGSKALWDYSRENFIEPNVKCGRIIDDVGCKTGLSMKNITSDSIDAHKVEMLNCEAFPEEERMSFEILMQFADNRMMDCVGFYDDETFVGFAVMMATDNIVYISFFAIQGELRSQGYGSSILKLIKENFSDKQIILDIEPLDENSSNYEQRKTRKSFYLRNGFFSSGYSWSYSDLTFEFLCSSKPIKIDEFADFIEKFRTKEFNPSFFKTLD